MINLDKSWLVFLEEEFKKPYMKDIRSFLENQIKLGKTPYPHPKNIFNALNTTKFEELSVVILGQDPYHGENQAHGLSFSVQKGVKRPPSLRNIFKEIENDLGRKSKIDIGENGDLSYWAENGVLLLNAILTVEASKPASHSKIGWEKFTDKIIETISNKKENIVFLLWGSFAQSKKYLIDTKKHYILESAHPSPLSAHRGFFGSKHFSKTNDFLKSKGKKEIDW